MSRLQLGLSTFLHRRFGSRRILDVLSSIGVAASYSDTAKYEVSTVYHPQPFILPPETGSFVQFAADNVDINVYTIDGHNTVHIMGVIKMITPSEAIAPEQPIKKQTTMSSAHDLALKAHVPIQVYENYN